jgi:mRNA-degrading endonuclease toxin of MazEF toxin-antitoxin module
MTYTDLEYGRHSVVIISPLVATDKDSATPGTSDGVAATLFTVEID